MLESEKIKLEIARLTSEANDKKALLQATKASASHYHRQVGESLSHFADQERATIERVRKGKIVKAFQSFSETRNALKIKSDAHSGLTYVAWNSPVWSSFDIQNERPALNQTRFGEFTVKGKHRSLQIPATLGVLGGKNVAIRATGSGRKQARQILRNIAFRLLASLPPGKLRFTFIDPVELGSTAAGLVGTLPDFLTGGLAWHEERDIQDQLSLIETRIAAIKTKYLGIRFPSIEQYNAYAGTIEEPYWLVVISDCPVRFGDTALQKLLSIAKNGPQAGIYLAIMLDTTQKKCTGSLISEIGETAIQIVCPDQSTSVFIDDTDFRDVGFLPDVPPTAELIEKITEQVNKTAASAQNVKVRWEAPASENWWKEDSRHGLKTPLGTFGARQTQHFEIDEKLLNSALIIGKPGSGKSRLLHVLICGLATRYSPDELSLYLLDCKQVEFKDYATHRLPHARVIAIESEREFGLSVLRRLNGELDSRKTEFSAAGETSLSSYRDKTGKLMPRILLIVDEFHELLNSDDPLAKEAANILDRLVRLGRALGINIVLASQTLGGQTTLLSSTKNQIPIRVVLQCSELDSISALGQDNGEARLLERPGEAIYNSANGRREGNNRFQISWLPDMLVESLLDEITARATDRNFSITKPPVIFDGNSLADVRQNITIKEALQRRGALENKKGTSAWLGEPIEMKESTAAVFKRQSRANLLILGQNEYEHSCVSMLITSVVSVAAQRSPQDAQFIVLNLTDATENWSHLPEICKSSFPHQISLIAKSHLAQSLNEMVALIEKRAAEPTPTGAISTYFCIFGLHRERNLRRSDVGSSFAKIGSAAETKTMSNAELLSKLSREGPAYGVHCLIWCDTFSNFERVFQRKDIDEFGLRVALQMSESDSRSLLDSDAANCLGPHRAIFLDDEKHGKLERFRPYSLVSSEWIAEVGRQLTK